LHWRFIPIGNHFAIQSRSGQGYLDGRNPGMSEPLITYRDPQNDTYLQWNLVPVDVNNGGNTGGNTGNTGNTVNVGALQTSGQLVVDTAENIQFIDLNSKITVEGRIVNWQVGAGRPGKTFLQVYRPTSVDNLGNGNYTLVGESQFDILNGVNNYRLTSELLVKPGDFIGWRYPTNATIQFVFHTGNVRWLYGNSHGLNQAHSFTTGEPRSYSYVVTIERVNSGARNDVSLQSGNYNSNYYGTGHPFESNTIGERILTQHVVFPTPFGDNQHVQVVCGLTYFDASNGHNIRINVSANNVTTKGFDLVFKTWYDSVIYGVGAFWLAHTK